jgi:eukaryotic-like serine/threonine-protein kinase
MLSRTMTLVPGTRLGTYEILSLLGSGGMGEVYRARDTKLNRDVALKILPEVFTVDSERVARFHREAQLLASLNHPNIATIHGWEESDGIRALVLEVVEGPTLAERIAERPIPLDEALTIARQTAEALEAAHEKGVVHRDLKPANIKLTSDGKVKVLDFGLAKLLDTETSAAGQSRGKSPGLTNSPTLTTPAMTMAGVILGTAAYMSPEQARGKAADKRVDIWAFGCVLYETLTGRRVFDADEVSDTLAFVLTKDPDWSALPASTPPAIRRLLRRCLAKDRNARLPDIGSARLEIDDAHAEPSSTNVDAGSTGLGVTRTTPSVRFVVAAIAAAALSALITWMMLRPRPVAQPVTRVLVGVAPAERLLSGIQLDAPLARGRPSRTAMATSPDGRSLAFSAERDGRVQLYLRRFDQLEATGIAGTEGASNPFFSPDGQSLGFYAAGALKTVPLNGGPVVELCKTPLVFGASWGRTGQIVFARQTGGLWQVSAAGGTPSELTKLETGSGDLSHRLPQLLPDGQAVLFTVTKTGFPSWDDTLIAVQSLANGHRKILIEGGADARFAATGHLVYLRRGTLMAVPFDPSRLEVTGAAVGLVADVMQAANIQPTQIDSGAGQFAVSESGSLVYVTGGVFPQDRWSLVWMDRTGRSEPLHLAPGAYLAPRLSPDGKRIAFNSTTGDWDLWTYDVARGIASRLPMEGDQSVPVWTPDGSRLMFTSLLKGTRGLFWINADGSGSAQRVMTSTGGVTTPTSDDTPRTWVSADSWTADGSAMAISYQGGISLLPSDGKTEPRQILMSGTHAEFSPDGRWLAYRGGEPGPGTSRVYVQPYPSLDRREQVSVESGTSPTWRRDGREMYYVENASAEGSLKIRMMAVPISTTPTFVAGSPRVLFEGPFRNDGPFRGYDITPDGQRFLMVQEVPQPPTSVSQMILVQNWVEELKQRVPANSR